MTNPQTPKTNESKTTSDYNTLISNVTANSIANQVIHINASQSIPLKLNPNNYSSWYIQLETLLLVLDLKGYVDDSFPCPATDTSSSTPNVEAARWIRKDKLIILHAIIVSLTKPIV